VYRRCYGIYVLDSRWYFTDGLCVGRVYAEGPLLLNTTSPKNGKKYAIITGKPELTADASKLQILNKMKDIKNSDGSLIVLVTQTVSEGVDLKISARVHIPMVEHGSTGPDYRTCCQVHVPYCVTRITEKRDYIQSCLRSKQR
jgi:hypothetical protein